MAPLREGKFSKGVSKLKKFKKGIFDNDGK